AWQEGAMEGLDAALSEDQRLALRLRHAGRRLLALGLGHAQVGGLELDVIELLGVLDQCRVTARAHVGDAVGHAAVDILVGLPIAPEEGRKVPFESRRRGVQPERPHYAALATSRKRSTQCPMRSGRVFSAARLTMKREVMSAMCSTSTRPLSRNV